MPEDWHLEFCAYYHPLKKQYEEGFYLIQNGDLYGYVGNKSRELVRIGKIELIDETLTVISVEGKYQISLDEKNVLVKRGSAIHQEHQGDARIPLIAPLDIAAAEKKRLDIDEAEKERDRVLAQKNYSYY